MAGPLSHIFYMFYHECRLYGSDISFPWCLRVWSYSVSFVYIFLDCAVHILYSDARVVWFRYVLVISWFGSLFPVGPYLILVVMCVDMCLLVLVSLHFCRYFAFFDGVNFLWYVCWLLERFHFPWQGSFQLYCVCLRVCLYFFDLHIM